MKRDIIEKLRKLIRHERSAREIGSLAEAANFAAKIQQLLDDYNLSLSEIDVEESRSTVAGERVDVNISQYWQKSFLNDIALIHGCKMILKSPSVLLVGNEIDRLIVVELFNYFESLGRDLASGALKAFQRTPGYTRKRKKHFYSRQYTTSFLYGYIVSLVQRLHEQHEASKAAAANSETGLIYIGNKLADAEAWVSKNLKIVSVKKKPVKTRDDAYWQGREAGDSVALTTKTML